MQRTVLPNIADRRKQAAASQKLVKNLSIAIRYKRSGSDLLQLERHSDFTSMDVGSEPYCSSACTVLSGTKDTNRIKRQLLEKKALHGVMAEEKKDEIPRSDLTALDGRGIALGFRHQIEKNDPKHHPWLNGFYTQELGTAHTEWLESKAKENFFDWIEKNAHRFPEIDNYRILYLPDIIAKQYLVSTNQEYKLTYEAKGGQVLDTSVRDSKRGDQYIYSMDLNGNLFIGPEGPVKADKPYIRLQHPSFTAGERVICAGKIKIRNGKVTHIDNESGHYLPGAFSLSRLVDELDKRKVLDEKVTIQVRSQRFFEPTKLYSLDEFRDRIRVWPGSPLAKRDLSEKSNSVIIDRAIDRYISYKNKFCLRWLFSSQESYTLAKELKNEKNYAKKFELAQKYMTANPNRAFSKALRKELTETGQRNTEDMNNYLNKSGI